MSASRDKNHNRLTATLIALAASMVVGAGLLNWVHDLTALPGGARALLTSTALPDPDWQLIEIHTEARSSGPVPFHHFYIGPDGDEHDTLAWRQKLQDENSSRSIHILMADQPGVIGPTRKQWETLVSRVRTLQTRFGIPAMRIALRPPQSPASPDERTEFEQTERMLQTAGLAG